MIECPIPISASLVTLLRLRLGLFFAGIALLAPRAQRRPPQDLEVTAAGLCGAEDLPITPPAVPPRRGTLNRLVDALNQGDVDSAVRAALAPQTIGVRREKP